MAVSVEELSNAVESLRIAKSLIEESILKQPDQIELHKALRDACIQRFEFCVELAWKTSMKKLGLDVKAPNPAIREMAQNKLISDTEAWFSFLSARNKTSHTYDEEVARQVYQVVEGSLPEFDKLVLLLKK